VGQLLLLHRTQCAMAGEWPSGRHCVRGREGRAWLKRRQAR
jgi:hypothetical protein